MKKDRYDLFYLRIAVARHFHLEPDCLTRFRVRQQKIPSFVYHVI